jgi:hypothetical protein
VLGFDSCFDRAMHQGRRPCAFLVPIGLALSALACGGAPPPPVVIAAPEPFVIQAGPRMLFPERPELDAIAPRRERIFKQETWTDLPDGSGAEHCHEWAFDPAEQEAIRADVNVVLARLGIASRLDGEEVREGDLVIILRTTGSDVLAGFEGDLLKLTVCTESVAAMEDVHAFITPLEARGRTAIADGGELGLTADLGWERTYADGRRQIGVRWRGLVSYVASDWLMRHGYREESTSDGYTDLVRGLERVQLRDEVWWQIELRE